MSKEQAQAQAQQQSQAKPHKVASVSFYTLTQVFDTQVSAVNAERKDLTLRANWERRCVEIRHTDEKWKGRVVLVPFEALLSFSLQE